jgi:hypothetical protein
VQHYLYSSSGNTVGVDEYLGFFEVGDDDYICRHLEIRADGAALRYTEQRPADEYGILPEGTWSSGADDSKKPEYGHSRPISPALFEAMWRTTKVKNEPVAE